MILSLAMLYIYIYTYVYCVSVYLCERKQLKVRQARHAIDCLSPPIYSHMTVKPKKLQLEHERIWKVKIDQSKQIFNCIELATKFETFIIADRE